MKNQLLEDLDDSQSRIPVAPLRRVQAVTPPRPAAPASAPAREHAGVWRKRAPPPRHAAWTPRPLRQETRAQAPPAAPPEPPRAAPRTAPDIAAFSSRAPDWSRPVQPEPPPWTERWGRKALGWSFGLGAAVAIAAGAAWMMHETRVESSLAVVADHTQAPAAAGAPAVPAAAPLPEPEAALPPLKLLPPEPVAAAPVQPAPLDAVREPTEQDEAQRLDAATSAALAAATAAAAPPPPPKKPAAKRAPERRVAATPAKRKPATAKKPAPPPARERALARAPTVPTRSVPSDQPDPESPLAETLRMCRAAGYHATACLKRGCEATRFGLVCRG